MSKLLLPDTLQVPQSSTKTNNSLSKNSSVQTSNDGQYLTPRVNVQTNKISSDSDSTLTDHNSNDDTDHEDSVYLSTKHVHSNVSTPDIDIELTSQVDKTKFFSHNSSKNSKTTRNKPKRKRDKIRSLFKKKSHRLNNNTSDDDINQWDEMLVKTLFSMQQDAHEIIAGLEEIDQPITDNSRLNRSESIITRPRLSFVERQREKIELMKIAQMLYPPNLLTYHIKESSYAYTDIIEPHNFYFLRMIKQIPDENLFIQHKPFRHKKIRYRTQRGLLRMQHDYKNIKHILYGRTPFKSHQEVPSFDVRNYRIRLEKTFLEVRRQIAEYDRINASKDNKHRQSITRIIGKMNTTDAIAKAQIEDYQAKLRPIEYIDKNRKNELNSAPYIPPRARYRSDNTKKDDKNERLIDSRFDPNTFVDLNEEADEFFGPDIPFWDQSLDSRLSSFSPSSLRCQSDQLILPSKLEDSDRCDSSFTINEKNLMTPVENHNDDLSKQSNDSNDEYFDCVSLLSQQKISQSSLLSINSKISTSSYDQDTVEF